MSYGISFAQKLLDEGKFAEAAAAATRAIAADAEDPEPLFERATAYANLDRYAEAATDLERALKLDEEARVLETDFLDDAYFSALLGAARKEPVAEGVKRLDRYAEIFPEGRHVADARDWQKRLRGELPSQFVKERLESD
jgi:tetratricopeptide (TPR) repeat protein